MVKKKSEVFNKFVWKELPITMGHYLLTAIFFPQSPPILDLFGHYALALHQYTLKNH